MASIAPLSDRNRRSATWCLLGLLVAACGGGGGDTGAGAPAPAQNARYELSFSGARIENAEASVLAPKPTILQAQLILDGEVIATASSTTGSQDAPFVVGMPVRRNAGQSTLQFKIVAQTVTVAPYIVTPNGFIGVFDTQSGRFTSHNLNLGSLSNPYTGALRAGEAISVQVNIP